MGFLVWKKGPMLDLLYGDLCASLSIAEENKSVMIMQQIFESSRNNHNYGKESRIDQYEDYLKFSYYLCKRVSHCRDKKYIEGKKYGNPNELDDNI